MSRSSGFGSTPRYLRPYQTRFRFASPMTVKLATERKSLTHYTKGTPSPQLNWPSMGQLSGLPTVSPHARCSRISRPSIRQLPTCYLAHPIQSRMDGRSPIHFQVEGSISSWRSFESLACARSSKESSRLVALHKPILQVRADLFHLEFF